MIHWTGILLCTFGWLLTPWISIIQCVTIVSWILNDNNCLISQWELTMFGTTCSGNKTKVPRRWRYLLYANFLAGMMYRLI